jgi:RNA polymerase sigma-54 factor
VQFQKPMMVQKQEQRLSPQLIQGIKILSLPLQDLKTRIEEELEVNPALELVEDRREAPAEALPERDHTVMAKEDGDYFENSSDPGYDFENWSSGAYDDEAGDNKRRFMEGVLTRPESLHDHLIWQLRLQPLSEEHFQIGELLIRNLDENGFHREDPALLVPEDQMPLMRHVIALIQGFEPAGTCVQDYKESLLAQSRQYSEVPPGVPEIIESHLDLIDKGKYKEIARKLRLTEEEVVDALHFIQQLTPFPGRLYSSDLPQYVVPDLEVVRREDEFVIILNDEEIPVLGINPFFNKLSHKGDAGPADRAADSPEVRQFVQAKIRDARSFIYSIRTRNENLLKVANALLAYQREFFLKGPKAIVPLTLKDIAAEIGVHETTVSRLTNGKYIQTEWGLYELKFFFSSAVGGTDGGVHSKESVKQVIKEIIVEEGGQSLSDQRISELLEKRGIKIARRTVAKYRKELDIDSSYGR